MDRGFRRLRAVGLFFATALCAWSQGQVGTLNGTVVDSTGAVVPGAAVSVKNIATGVEEKTTTTAAGAYTFPYLPQGTYTIRVTAPGFKAAQADNVILRVAQTLTMNMTLTVGEITEQVTISSTPELLETGSAEMGRYISTEEYKSWPILVGDGQRQIQEFIFDSLPGTTGDTFQGSINGGQQYSHEILIEGMPVGRSDLSGGNNNEFSPSAEAIGEFKLQEGAVGAQYNGGQTAVANFSIKSGTNGLHGSGFWYVQNEAFDALSLADKTEGSPKAKHRENNEGYSLGGPVYIPKIYDGRNKTFFFTNFEKDHYNNLVFNGFTQVIPNEYRRGDFSGLLDPAWTGNPDSGTQIGTDALGRPVLLGQIFDPATTRIVNGQEVRDPFPGNMIPQSRFNTVTNNIFNIGVAEPTFDTMVRNIQRVGTCCPFFDLHTVGVKGDHNFSDRHHFSMYYNRSYRFRNNNGGQRFLPVPGPPTSSWQDQKTPGHMVRVSLNSTLTPRIINRIGAGYNRFLNENGAPLATINQDWASQIGIQNTSPVFFPQFNFSGAGIAEWQGGTLGKLGVGFFGAGANGSWIINDDLTWVNGKHSFHFGYQYMKYYYDERNFNGSGNFNFSPRSTGMPGFLSDTGSSVASFMLGAVDTANRGIVTLNSAFRQPYHAFYVADDWKVTPRLTVNAGFRWEIIPAYFEKTGRESFIDLSAPNPEAGGRLGALAFGRLPAKTYWKEFGPRLGFAYQATDKIVVRAGYAMLNTPPIRNDWGYGGFTYGYNGTINVRQGSGPTGFVEDPAMYLDQPFPNFAGTLPNTDPSSGNFDASQTTAPDANRPGYTQNWNFTVQYQLPGETVIEAAYVGNKGTRLWGGSQVFGEMNGLRASELAKGDLLLDPISAHPELAPFAGFPDFMTVAQALRPYPQYNSVAEAFPYNTNSNYNALQLTVTRHLTTGLGFLAAYTWSKTISQNDSNGPSGNYVGYYGASSVQDYYNRKLERSIASFNFPHFFKLTWVWETPFGKGRHWDLHALNYVLGGWQLSAIHSYRSGAPLDIAASGLTLPDGISGGIRADVLSSKMTLRGAPSHADFSNPVQYLDPAAFANPPTSPSGVPLRVGTAPRFMDGLRGPKAFGETFRMSKKFPIKERVNIGAGMTMTNPFNRHGPYIVSTTVGDSGFGQLLEGGGGRTMQLDVRVEF